MDSTKCLNEIPSKGEALKASFSISPPNSLAKVQFPTISLFPLRGSLFNQSLLNIGPIAYMQFEILHIFLLTFFECHLMIITSSF